MAADYYNRPSVSPAVFFVVYDFAPKVCLHWIVRIDWSTLSVCVFFFQYMAGLDGTMQPSQVRP